MRSTLILLIALAPGCSKEMTPSAHGKNATASPRPPSASDKKADDAPGKKAEVTPELAAKAKSILEAQPDAPLGTTVPFSLNGTNYIARFEEHENTEGDPDRPPGRHKGVTVYVRD
jgi:hypothetical protein